MKTLTALGMIAIGGVIASRALPQARGRVGHAVGRRVLKRMEQMMASLPEGAPPRLIMSVLPRLQAQNDQIIAMLREQNELLRRQLHLAS